MRLAELAAIALLAAALIVPRHAAAQNVDEVTALGNRVNKLYQEGKFAEAEVAAEKYVARAKARHGERDIRYGAAISWLAYVYVAQGRLAEATPLFERTVAIFEKALGVNHPEVANALGNVAEMHRLQGRYADVEPVVKRSIAILEKKQGRDSPNLAAPVNTLAIVYFQQGRFAESEAAFKRSLAILEKSFGREHNNVAAVLVGLASVYQRQERYAEAEKLIQRSIAIREKVLGRDHADLAYSLDALAILYQAQNRDAEVEPLVKRALAIREKALGPDHSDLAISLTNLAAIYAKQDRLAEAEPLYQRAIAIEKKSLGPDHAQLASTLNNLGDLYRKQGKEQAEAMHLEALRIRQKTLEPDSPDTAQSYHNLAHVYYDRQNWTKATEYLRQGARIMIRRSQRGAAAADGTTVEATSRKTEAAWAKQFFFVLIKAAHRAPAEPAERAALADEMFQAAQWAQSSDAAASLAQMAARGAARDPGLSALVRERQDMLAEWVKHDAERIAAASRAIRDQKAEAATTREIARIDARVAAIDKSLAEGFPDYAALARPRVLSLAQVQAVLRDDEALVLAYDTQDWDPAPEETFVWVVTKTDSRWTRSELGTLGLARNVAALRCGLDYQGSWIGPTSHCRELLQVSYSQEDARAGRPLPFDAARAHLLYKALLGDAQDLIVGKQLLVVPSGPLTQLPFQVLVTVDPGSAAPGVSDTRKLAWLARTNAITVLPAVSSLEALRRSGKASSGKRPFAGIGNPLLDGPDASYRDVKWQAMSNASCDALTRVLVAEARGLGVMPVALRGGIADVASLRQAIPLPETAEEVCDVARDIGADETDILLGLRAAEGEIKRMSADGRLASYRMLHFATHGALAGQVSGSTEPGLLLTPPRKATQDDDGYLSASEIASLKLDADWVILSACNTAAGGAEGAEALSGLARAFFYAGARALLVSHWYVDSRATVALIRGAFAELKADPKIGRAEALRRSMLALADNKDEQFAQPAAWAPFAVVGEGAAPSE